MTNARFWAKVDSLVEGASIVVDRPKGSIHPRLPTLIYPLDYGFLSGTTSGDGHGVDVWSGSLKRRRVTGVICSVDLGKRDFSAAPERSRDGSWRCITSEPAVRPESSSRDLAQRRSDGGT